MEAVADYISDYERERGKPMPTFNHAIVQKNLLVSLDVRYRKTHTVLPEINITMPERPDTVPDIAIYPKLPVDFLHDIQSMTEMPLTVIEIISPSQSNDNILAKFERYFAVGIQSCWLVIPSFQSISVYSAPGKYQFFMSGTTLSDPVTGFELSVDEVFE